MEGDIYGKSVTIMILSVREAAEINWSDLRRDGCSLRFWLRQYVTCGR